MKKRHIKKIILSLTVVSTLLISYGCASKEIEEVANMDESNTYVENTTSESLEEVGNTEITESAEQSTEESSLPDLEETGSKVNFDRGESKGEVVINKVDSEQTEVENTEGQGGDKSLVDDLQAKAESGENPYYSENEDGTYEFTPEFIAIVQESDFGAGASGQEISDYFNSDSGKSRLPLLDLSVEAFIEICKTDAEKYGTIADTREPSANQTAPSVSADTSASATGSSSNAGGSTGSSTEGSLPAGWIPDDQLIWATEESNASGIGMSDDFTPGGGLTTDIWINGMEE